MSGAGQPDREDRGGAQLALVLGLVAMAAIPLSFVLALGPVPVDSVTAAVIPLARFGGLAAAVAAFLLGRRARVAGDRSTGAVWAPRLGGAAVMGFVVMSAGYGTPAS